MWRLYQKRFSIWGAGKYGKQLLELLLQLGIEVDYIIDENPDLQGQTEYKIPIVSFLSYKSLNSGNVIIITVKNILMMFKKNWKKTILLEGKILSQFVSNWICITQEFYIICVKSNKDRRFHEETP